MAEDAPPETVYMYLLQLMRFYRVKVLRVTPQAAVACLRVALADVAEPVVRDALRILEQERITTAPGQPVARYAKEHNDHYESALEDLCRFLVESFKLAQAQQREIVDKLSAGDIAPADEEPTRLDLVAIFSAFIHHDVCKDVFDICLKIFANAEAPSPEEDFNNFRRVEVIAMCAAIASLRKNDPQLDDDAIKDKFRSLFEEVGTPPTVADFQGVLEEVIAHDAVRLPLFVPNWLLAPHMLIPRAPHFTQQVPHFGPSLHLPSSTVPAPRVAAFAPFAAASAPFAAAFTSPSAAHAPSLAACAPSAADAPPHVWPMTDAELQQATLAAAHGVGSYSADFLRQPLLLLRPSAQPMPDVMRLLSGTGTQQFPCTLYSPTISELEAPAPFSPAPGGHMSANSMPAEPQPGSARATADALVDWLARYILSTGPFTPAQDATFVEKAMQLAKLQEGQELSLTYNAVCQLFDVVQVRRPGLELLPGLQKVLSPKWPGSCTVDGAPEAKKAKVATVNDIVTEEIKAMHVLQRHHHKDFDDSKAVVCGSVRVMLALLQMVQGRKLHDLKDVAARLDTKERHFASDDLRDAADILYDMVQGNMGAFAFGGTPLAASPLPAAPADAMRTSSHFVKPSNEPVLDSHTDVNDFFIKYDLYSTIAKIPPAERIARALLCIKSSAVVNQWLAYVRDLQHTPTWLEFQQQIRLYTNGHCAADKALDSLSQCVQGGQPMDKYIAKYTRLVSQAALDSKSPFVIRGFVRGIADDSIRTILNDGPAHDQQWDSLSAVTARAAKLATAKFSGKPSTSQPRSFSFQKKHNSSTSAHNKPFHKKWQHKSNGKPFRRADTIKKEVKQAINAAIEDGTLATPQHMAAAMVPQPYHQPFMHGGYNNGGGHGGGKRGNWTQPRGKRGGQDKRQQREEQQQPQQQADGAGPSRVGRSRFSG